MIEIEFGEVGIDASLVAAQKAGTEDLMMLNNGCICCTVRGDLVCMIVELVERKKGKFDHIVIETTGLPNPSSIIQIFYAEDKVFNDVKLDRVVTLVDAMHAGFHLDKVKPKGIVNEAVEQIAYADQIIVNKIDLVDEPQISSLIKRIKQTAYGKVELDYVHGIGGFDLERIESAVNSESKDDHAEDGHDHHHEHDHHHSDHEHGHHDHHEDDHDHHHDHSHDPGVSSVSIVCEGSLDLEKMQIYGWVPLIGMKW